MSSETALREQICNLASSMFARGLTHGSSGNISAQTEDGCLLVTPTGSSFGYLDPAKLAKLDPSGRLISGDLPTKELPLHSAFYETRKSAGAVVHLHSCHSVAMSMMPDANADNFLPALTPYSIMQLGKVKLLPYYLPGHPEIGEAIRGLAGKRAAVMLANHGPVVAGKDVLSACNAIEEFEATAKLSILMRGVQPALLDTIQIQTIVRKFDVGWED